MKRMLVNGLPIIDAIVCSVPRTVFANKDTWQNTDSACFQGAVYCESKATIKQTGERKKGEITSGE